MFFFVLVLSALILFAGCDSMNQIKVPFSLDVFPGEFEASAMEVDTRNGSIEIFYWNESFVRIEGQKSVSGLGDLEAEIEKIQINYDVNLDQFHVYASFPADINKLFKNVNYGANFVIYIPRGYQDFSDFKVDTSNGRIIMEGFDGFFDLRTSNGRVKLSDCTGFFKARSSNGTMELSNIQGEMDISTSNGGIQFANCFLTGSNNHFNTSNGRISGDITLPLTGNASFITSNGNVHLTIPSNTGANFTANTSNGNISVKGMPVTYITDNKTTKTGRINDGGVRLEMKTSNGSISLGQ